MKRFSLKLLIIIVMIFSSTLLKAQRVAGEGMLTGGVGLSIWNLYAGALNVSDSILAKSTPTVYGTYDYGITKDFSIGGGVSYNSFSLINPNYSYVNSSGVIVEESISVKYSRVNLCLRPLYHWGKRENFEWFTGLRLGYSFWTATLQTTDPYYKDDYFRRDMYSAQLLFGSRAFLTDLVALTFDLGIGAPYFASLGLSVKL